jgi:multiple sugar transport system substrate-binding protein
MVRQHRVVPPDLSSLSETDIPLLFSGGKAAMFYSGLRWTPQFREIRNFDWDVAMFPGFPGVPRAFPTGGSGYGILKSSANKKAAWEFIRFITGGEGIKKMMADGLVQPASMDLAHSRAFTDGLPPFNKKLLLEAVHHVKYAPFCGNWIAVRGTINDALEKVWLGQENVEEVMGRLGPILERTPPSRH